MQFYELERGEPASVTHLAAAREQDGQIRRNRKRWPRQRVSIAERGAENLARARTVHQRGYLGALLAARRPRR